MLLHRKHALRGGLLFDCEKRKPKEHHSNPEITVKRKGVVAQYPVEEGQRIAEI